MHFDFSHPASIKRSLSFVIEAKQVGDGTDRLQFVEMARATWAKAFLFLRVADCLGIQLAGDSQVGTSSTILERQRNSQHWI